MLCPSCGKQRENDVYFCSNCGAQVVPDNHTTSSLASWQTNTRALPPSIPPDATTTSPSQSSSPPSGAFTPQFRRHPNAQDADLDNPYAPDATFQQSTPDFYNPYARNTGSFAQSSPGQTGPMGMTPSSSFSPGQSGPVGTPPSFFSSGQTGPMGAPPPFASSGQTGPMGAPPPFASSNWAVFPSQMPAGQGAAIVQPPPAPNKTQKLLIQFFQPQLASSPWLGMALGSLVALLLGLVGMGIIGALLNSLAANATASTGTGSNAFLTAMTGTSNFIGSLPLGNSWRNTLLSFLLAHGIGYHIALQASAFGSQVGIRADYTAPQQLLLILPALCLTYGGYLAACTDLSNRAAQSLWRGAAIALPYTLLLLLLSTQVNGDIDLSAIPQLKQLLAQAGATLTLNVDMLTLLLYGLLWGALFGLLGASIKYGQGQWRGKLHAFLARNPRPQITGIIAGGSVATGLGLALSFLVVLCALACLVITIGSTTGQNPLATLINTIASQWLVMLTPSLSVALLAFSFGAPIVAHTDAANLSSLLTPGTSGGGVPASYTNTQTLSLTGGDVHLVIWQYLIVLIPIICLFVGGRVSVTIARTRGIGPAAIQGALTALPFTLLMATLAAINTLGLTLSLQGSSTLSSQGLNMNATFSVGVGIANMLLWALISGALCGALGGMYQASAARGTIGAAWQAIATRIRSMLEPSFATIDRLTRRDTRSPRSQALNLLYGTVMITTFVVLLAFCAGIFLITLNVIVTAALNQIIRIILSLMLIALPGLGLLLAVAAALLHSPTNTQAGGAHNGNNAQSTMGGII